MALFPPPPSGQYHHAPTGLLSDEAAGTPLVLSSLPGVPNAEVYRQMRQVTWRSVWINLLLSTTQVIVGWLGRSQALIADGVHSFSDLLSDIVVLLAAHGAEQDADETHPYGHQRFENAASLMLGLLLLGIGLAMIGAAVHRFQVQTPQQVSWITLAVALGTLVCKEVLFRYMIRVGQRLRSQLMIANAWHTRSDALSSLMVAIGLVGNLAGFYLADTLAAALVGGMIVRLGWQFSASAFNDLTDHALDPAEVADISATLCAIPGVESVHELRTRKMGDSALIDAHLLVAPTITVSEGHQIAECARMVVLRTHRACGVLIHIDPEDDDSGIALPLPARAEVDRLLREALNAPEDTTPDGVLLTEYFSAAELALHYLDGHITVDLHLARHTPPPLVQALTQRLALLPGRYPWLAAIRCWQPL